VFDEIVFPFSEMHPNAGARLRKEILLLPNHHLNLGDAISGPDVTDGQPGSSSSFVLQDSTKKLKQNGAKTVPNTCDNGVSLQPPSGVPSHDNTPDLGRHQTAPDPRRIPRLARTQHVARPHPRGLRLHLSSPTHHRHVSLR
jgi:hypothetical protein